MLFYMTSKVFRDNFLRYEPDKNIHDAQYIIASCRIYKTREYKNMIYAKNLLFPSSHVFMKRDKDEFRDAYFNQLDECKIFLAYLINDSIRKGHNIIFMCTPNEDKCKYLKLLSEYIFIKFGYPCYEYDKYSKGITPLLKYSVKDVMKEIQPLILEGSENERSLMISTERGKKKYIKKLKKNKLKLIEEVKRLGVYSKKLKKHELIEIVRDYLEQ